MKTRSAFIFSCLLFVMSYFLPTSAQADERFYQVPLASLEVTDGKLPVDDHDDVVRYRFLGSSFPRVVLAGEGEAWFVPAVPAAARWREGVQDGFLGVHSNQPLPIVGKIFFPKTTKYPGGIVSFSIQKNTPTIPSSRGWRLIANRFHILASSGVSGAAWFRHREFEAKKLALAEGEESDRVLGGPVPTTQVEGLGETFELLSGGRAVAENLRLEQLLTPRQDDEEEVTYPLSELEGITVKEVDWTELNKDLNPEVDPLAGHLPRENYALFFPGPSALIRLVDEARTVGTPALSWMETQSLDSLTWERYQKQMCLPLTGLSRIVAPLLAGEVALTGSDPYLRTGSDVALLFTTSSPVLEGILLLRHWLAAEGIDDATRTIGEIGGSRVDSVATPDRRISSHLATFPGGVIVSNSLPLVTKILTTSKEGENSMLHSPEYRFFRARYPRNNPRESGLLIVPDAAIRRWGGPRWRILASRRTRALAVVSEVQAQWLKQFVTEGPGAIKGIEFPEAGKIVASPVGAHSETYGNLVFQTPIAELPIDRVTQAEAIAYNRFRSLYERNWRKYFDPIGVSFGVSGESVDVDLTIFPLGRNSDYEDFIELTQGTEMAPDSGDPHDGVLARFGMSINKESTLFRKLGGFASIVDPAGSGSPLSWLGDSLTIYADDTPFWDEAVNAMDPDPSDWFLLNIHKLPVAIQVEVSGSLQVAAFLSSLRALSESSAPGLVIWENFKFKGRSYVKVSGKDRIDDSISPELALYYAVTPNSLLLTLSEDLIKRALTRMERREEGAATKELEPWLGKQVAFQSISRVVTLLDKLRKKDALSALRLASWSNIPILNQWKQLYPELDPMAFHEQFWGVHLQCPSGQPYRWNDTWQTFESPVYGHPGEPTEVDEVVRPQLIDVTGASLGLTFELGGLRARLSLER